MAFDVNTITLQGAIAVASATVSNKLVIDGCDATTDVLTQAQAAQIATRPATPGSTTTEIALAGSTDNHVFAYAEFLLGESTGGDFNSFFLYGHLEDDTSTVFVISVCSSTSPVHLPATGDVTNRTEIQFDLTFTPNAEVVKVADTSMYCTRGEFLILKERAVTTHAEGTPTTGEAQNVYGVKTFKNGIKTDSISANTSAATYITIPRIENTQIKTDLVLPKTNNEKVTFQTGIKTSWISPSTTTYVEFTNNVRASSIGDKTHGTALYAKTIDNDSSATALTVTGHSAINDEPNDYTADLVIGKYGTGANIGFKFTSFDVSTNTYESLTISGNSISGVGTISAGNLSGSTLTDCILPSGTSSAPGIGMITLLYIVTSVDVGTWPMGQDVTDSTSQTISGVTTTPTIYFANFIAHNDTSVQEGMVYTSGTQVPTNSKWRLLTGAASAHSAANYYVYVLAMRIE